MSFVKMPQEDYVAMCDKLRAMLNEEQDYTSKDFIDKMDETILPNLDDTNFGNSSNLPTFGATNPEYYEDIAKAINELKTANPIQIQELNATENKIYESENNIVWNKVSVDVPNEIEPIKVMSGPIQNPFGTVEQYQQLCSKIANKEVTAFISGDLPNASQFQAVLQSSSAQLDFSTVNRVGPWSVQVYDVCWDDSGHEGPIWITDFYSWAVSGKTATMNVVTSNPNVTIKVFPYLGY